MFTVVRDFFWKENRSTVLLSITGVGGFLCLFSLLNNSNLEDSIVSDAIHNGPMFRVVVVAAIALACPNIMNNIADYVGYVMAKKNTKKPSNANDNKNRKIPILATYEKLIFIIGILILPIVSSCPKWSKAVLLTSIATAVQQQFVGGVIITSLNRVDGTYFPTFVAYITIFLLTAANVDKSFALNVCGAISTAECSALPIGGFNAYGTFTVIAIQSILILFWLSSVYVHSAYGEKVHAQYYRWPTWCGHQKEITSKNDKLPTKIRVQDGLLFFRIVYCVTILVWVIFAVIARYRVSGNFGHFDDQALMINFAPYLVFEFFALFIALRLVKHETVSALLIAIDAKNSLIDAKKTYVRYISHELRTPLSAANSGLQMLHADLSETASSTNPIDLERLDTLTDVCSAINTTVNILDDLLTFEKMESGLMELHLEDVNVESFVDSCVSIFHTPARGKNIDIKMELCDPSVDSSLPVDPTDLLSIDKFKMSQVLRNFMSNALKFTPDGGAISVRACFVPDRINEKNISNKTNNDQSINDNVHVKNFSSKFMQSFRHKPQTNRVIADIETGGRLTTPDVGNSGGHDTHPGGGTYSQSGVLRVSITDNGPGINPENQQRLFKEIIQFNPEVLQGGGGSGFGLFICKGICDLHHGTIEVFSEGEGKGARFSVSLPMQRSSENALQTVANNFPRLVAASRPSRESSVVILSTRSRESSQVAPSRPSKGGPSQAQTQLQPSSLPSIDSPELTVSNRQMKFLPPIQPPTCDAKPEVSSSSKRKRSYNSTKSYISSAVALSYRSDMDGNSEKYQILVVDDSPLNRKMLSKLLKSKGHDIEEAADGQIAVDKVKQKIDSGGSFDVILMDFVMPVMTGPEATKVLRAMKVKTPIFGVTGNALESDVKIFLAAGADIILIKPFSMVEFTAAMASIAAGAAGASVDTDMPSSSPTSPKSNIIANP